jgi:hypothetical protein
MTLTIEKKSRIFFSKKLNKGVYISNQKPYITTINKEIPDDERLDRYYR